MILHFDREPVQRFAELVGKYSDRELASATRSTVPLLALLKNEGTNWQDILQRLGVGALASAHVEYTVRSPQGRGKASHTDLMLRERGLTWAVEAKWTEPPYSSVGEFLSKGKSSSNRKDVLGGWLALLASYCNVPPTLDGLEGLAYQSLHRAASACDESSSPGMAYLQFTPLPDGKKPRSRHIKDDLVALRKLLGLGPGFRMLVFTVEMLPTAAFEVLKKLRKGEAATGPAVKQALISDTLFDFRTCSAEEI